MGCSSSKLNESVNVMRENNEEKENPEHLEIIDKIKEENIINENNKLNKDKEGNDNINLKREIRFPKATKLKEIELSSSDKKLSKSIANSLPKRPETNLKSFKDLIKSKTQK